MSDLWHYASFVDRGPKGDQFIGGIYVRGDTVEEALTRAHLLGINPGGEAQFVGPLTTQMLDENVPEANRERLLTREEVGE